jgi:hypothetical protein
LRIADCVLLLLRTRSVYYYEMIIHVGVVVGESSSARFMGEPAYITIHNIDPSIH